MTAEIAILNKTAVALAADSAVTIGAGSDAKIYNSVNKIFELHESAPVGIMVYGGLSFMGLPLETLIKQYRSETGSKIFATVRDYKNDFIAWLERSVPIEPEDEVEALFLICSDILRGIDAAIEFKIRDEIRRNGKYLRSKDNSIAIEILKDRLIRIKNYQHFAHSTKKYYKDIDAQFGAILDQIIESLITSIRPNKDTKLKIHKLVVEYICRTRLSSYRTGFVIAGFGDKERCPSLERFEVDGVIMGALRCVEGKAVDIGRRGPQADALGFAQSDMIDRFLHGIDPDLHTYTESIVSRSISETAREIISALLPPSEVDAKLNAIKPVIEKIQKEQMKNFVDRKDTEFTQPIFDMIRHMPKQEMSILAKALIDLTSLKRKMSREQESVGGEVDVAVISKSEGFVWVSRKHYFPSDLNHRFFARRYKSLGGSNGGIIP